MEGLRGDDPEPPLEPTKPLGHRVEFTRVARTFFPKTVAYAKSLPFESIGRCNIMGLDAHDHGTVHHDGDADAPNDVADHFVTFSPAGNTRLFLWDEPHARKTPVTGRALLVPRPRPPGVDADPFFRYSVRVDGVFKAEFLARVRGGGRRGRRERAAARVGTRASTSRGSWGRAGGRTA